jgi:hypothetical protein
VWNERKDVSDEMTRCRMKGKKCWMKEKIISGCKGGMPDEREVCRMKGKKFRVR